MVAPHVRADFRHLAAARSTDEASDPNSASLAVASYLRRLCTARLLEIWSGR